MGLFEEMERVKLRLIGAYERLLDEGRISEAEFEEILELLDRIDDISEEELRSKLGRFHQALGA